MCMFVFACSCAWCAQMMVVNRDIAPGDELVWNYKAISDKEDDPLCHMKCLCGRLTHPRTRCKHNVLTYVESI